MRAAVLLAVASVLLVVPAPARAAWSSASTGSAAGRAVVMPAGQQPAAGASGSDVTLRWPAALLPGGTAVAGYVITRYGANGQPAAVLADCSGTIGTTTCTEHNVPAGAWSYTDTPVQFSWTGQPSPPSQPVTVAAP